MKNKKAANRFADQQGNLIKRLYVNFITNGRKMQGVIKNEH